MLNLQTIVKNFTLYKLKKDATRLDFEFNFTYYRGTRENIAIIRDCISGIYGIKLNFEKSKRQGCNNLESYRR